MQIVLRFYEINVIVFLFFGGGEYEISKYEITDF